MHKFKWLLSYPSLYTYLASKRKKVDYEKLLYIKSVKKGNIIFDIGANVGNFTELFSLLSGRNGEVHCFEPIPEALLKRTSHLKNVYPNKIAAGDTDSRMAMSYDSQDSEKASLSLTNCTEKCEVKVIRLDDYVSNMNLKRIDFVKCDVEGYEFHTLKGMKCTLEAFHPQISLEITVSYQTKINIINFLKSIGYNSFRKIESGYPRYFVEKDYLAEGDYFYLHASSSFNS